MVGLNHGLSRLFPPFPFLAGIQRRRRALHASLLPGHFAGGQLQAAPAPAPQPLGGRLRGRKAGGGPDEGEEEGEKEGGGGGKGKGE